MKAKVKESRQHGQGMTEYIIIVALISIAAVAVYQYFGNTVRNQTAAIANELAGNDGTAAKEGGADSHHHRGHRGQYEAQPRYLHGQCRQIGGRRLPAAARQPPGSAHGRAFTT